VDEIVRSISTCQRCPLAKTRVRAVPGQGPVPAGLMLIGEAPGRSEDELGQPFSGAAGRVLDSMLEAAGLSRDRVYITSVIKCRPPKNRNPSKEEVAACAIHLQRQIERLQPRIIVLMGNVALKALVDHSLTIGTTRGKILRNDGLLYLPVYHPAAVLYNRTLANQLRDDFMLLAHLVADPQSGE
jgi:uracil-DNA glycosylase